MSTNPDINRLSLEERIKRLETRLPTVGAGGSADFFLDPKVVDQCPENAITDVGTGLVFRIDIPNFYNIQSFATGSSSDYPGRVFNNLEIKLVRFYPRMDGVILNCFTEMGRAWLKGPISSVPAAKDGAYAMRANYVFDDSGAKNMLFELMPSATQLTYGGSHNQSGFSIVLFSTATGSPLPFASIGLTAYSFKQPQNYTIYCSIAGAVRKDGKWQFSSAFPSCSFGVAKPVPFTAYPSGNYSFAIGASPGYYSDQIGRFTGANPQSLPDVYKPLFPTSWYS